MASEADIHPTDALRPGDQAELVRTWPAGTDGPRSKAGRVRHVVTVLHLDRIDDRPVGSARWFFEADSPDSAVRGGWGIGREPGGMLTTLLPYDEEI